MHNFLQIMLEECSDISGHVKLQVNAKKSGGVVAGAASGYQIIDMNIQNSNCGGIKLA